MEFEHNHLRMVEMCNNHPMFQFLFDESGTLLAANKRAMENLKEHLGENYTLQQYLAIGEPDGTVGPAEMYKEAIDAIFVQNKPCHRFPQLRYSKRSPGKYRWVLFEIWPLSDPVTQRKAVLVCEQNISQVKALEEHFKKQNERLEAQLTEALAQRDPIHKPAIDIDTPADKTLKMLDQLMRGLEVSTQEAMELRDAILAAGDLRHPVNFSEQMMRNTHNMMDAEVNQSLIQLLSTHRVAKGDQDSESEAEISPMESGSSLHSEIDVIVERNLSEQMTQVLERVNDWQFDAFELNEASAGRPLSLLSIALFKQTGLIEKLQLDERRLIKFLMRVEDGYPENPYHNRIHAADVLQALHVILVRGGVVSEGYTDEYSILACYLSAIIHDFEHKGVNNDFLVRVGDPLAVLYNDRSPMENHHLASAFSVMRSEEFDFMHNVGAKAKEKIRKRIIDMVLATDMKQHFAIQSTFTNKIQTNSNGNNTGNGRGKSLCNSPCHSADGTHKVLDEDQRSLLMQVVLKCADLGHLASPRVVHKRWVTCLEEELFRQGDREKELDITISPLMDRCKNGITKSQVGFFDIVALPLFQSFAQAFPDSSPLLEAVRDNYNMWREEATVFNSQNSLPSSSSRS